MDNNANLPAYLPQQNSYSSMSFVWDVIDDCVAGEDTIKASGQRYLRKTTGMLADSKYGDVMYKNYVYKANWFDFPSTFLENLDGLLWQKDPIINVPNEMDSYFIPSPAFFSNKSFLDVYRETATNVIKYARHAILLDPPDGENRAVAYPRLIQYNTRQIKNWGYTTYKGRSILKYVLLDESSYSYENESLSQEIKYRYRFLGLATRDRFGNQLETPVYYTYTGTDALKAIFDPPFDPSTPVIEYQGVLITFPNIHGKFAESIPFFCFSSTEMSLEPTKPLIYPLCKACLSLYRASADYEEYLFKQSFALLFGKGLSTDDIYLGTHKAITVDNKDADLKFVEISGNGLSEQRLAFENKYNYAMTIGYGLLTGDNSRTGKTVQNNVSVKSASLKSISKTLASGFTEICKYAALWRGLSDKEVTTISIIPNLEFTVASDTASILNAYTVWKGDGFSPGISDFDYYCQLRDNGKTVYTTFDEFKKAINSTQIDRIEMAKKYGDLNNTDNSSNSNVNDSQEKPAGEGGDSIPDVKR